MIGKAIGLDLGSKTCGVAISDALGMFAHPVDTLKYVDNMELLQGPLQEIITKERVKHIVLGYPKMMNNDVGPRAQLSEDFKEMLESWFKLPVTLVDERLTSVVANRTLIDADISRKRRKQVVDQLAAVNILQSYLDRQRFLEGR